MASNIEDTTNYAEALKIFYASKLTEFQKFHTWMYDSKDIQVPLELFNGKQFNVPVDLRTGVSVGSRPEQGALPEFYPHTPVQGVILPRRHYVSMAITGPLQAQGSGSQEGIWESVDEKLFRKATATFGEQLSRAMWTTGLGILCEVSSVSAIAGTQYTVTIKNKNVVGTTFSNPSGTAPCTTKYMLKYLNRKLVYGAASGGVQFAAATPTGRGVCTVLTVSTTTPYTTFTIDIADNPGAPPQANDVFVLGDAIQYGKHDYDQEIYGWQDVVGTADFMSVSTSTYPEWKGAILSANANTAGTPASPTEDRMQVLYDQIVNIANVDKVDALGVTPAVYRALTQVLRNKGGERYMPCDFKGGVERLAWSFGGTDVPIVSDFYAPDNEIAYISQKNLLKAETKGFEFDESNGGVWKWQPGTDSFVAYAKQYVNVGCYSRNAQGRLVDVLTPVALA